MNDTMETCIGASDDWYTPPEIFQALGVNFDLDPCSPDRNHWVPAKFCYVKADDGLMQDWVGSVFMNPPYGGRNGHVPWLRKFIEHGDGVAIVRAYTSAGWFHDLAVKAETMCFPRGKTKFIRPDGSIGKSPGHGIVILGMGEVCNEAVLNCELGLSFRTGFKQLDKGKRCGNCIGFRGDPLNSGFCYRVIDDKYIHPYRDLGDEISSDDRCRHYKRISEHVE